MAEKKPRQQVDGLGNLPKLNSAAEPRALNNYVRPGESEIHRPPQTNPMMKLADSLAALEPTLILATSMAQEQYITDEQAAGNQAAFDMGREKVNAMIKAGEIPAGASPYFARGFHRAALKQLSEVYHSQVFQDFHGEAGNAARESNNPHEMQKFLDESSKRFSKEWMGNAKFSALDLQEVFHPAVEQTHGAMLKAHADHRVKEMERQYEEIVSIQSGDILKNEFEQVDFSTGAEGLDAAKQRAGARLNELITHPDTGFGTNSGLHRRGNELVVEAVISHMRKTGQREFGDVLMHVRTKEGAPIGKIKGVQDKIQAAEEHLTSLEIQAENHAWQLEQRPFQRESLHRQPIEHQRQDQRWTQEQASFAEGKSEKEIDRSLTRRLYEGLDSPDSKRGVAVINEVLKAAKQSLPERVEHYEALLKAAHTRKSHVEDNPRSIANLTYEMYHNPLGFNDRKLLKAVESGEMSDGTMRAMMSTLHGLQANADHPFSKQHGFTEMVELVRKGSLKSPGDEFTAEGTLRAANAIKKFYLKRDVWLEKNPKGGMAEFMDYMNDQVQPILEAVDKDFQATKESERKSQETKGKAIADHATKLHVKQEADAKRHKETVEAHHAANKDKK